MTNVQQARAEGWHEGIEEGLAQMRAGGLTSPGSMARNMAKLLKLDQAKPVTPAPAPATFVTPMTAPSAAPTPVASTPGALKANMLRLIQSGEVGQDRDPE